MCGNFLASWSASGLDLGDPGVSTAESLALFGLPLTGEFEATLEDGTTHVVQWFERARFELHSENAPPYNVLLTRLGVAEVGEPEVQPGTPAAEDPATVETAIRTYLGPEIVLQRDFISAGVRGPAAPTHVPIPVRRGEAAPHRNGDIGGRNEAALSLSTMGMSRCSNRQ